MTRVHILATGGTIAGTGSSTSIRHTARADSASTSWWMPCPDCEKWPL